MKTERYVEIIRTLNWKKCESDSAVIFKTFFLIEAAMMQLAVFDEKKGKYLVKLDTELTDKVIELNDAPLRVSEIEKAITVLINRKIFEKVGAFLYSSAVNEELKAKQ